MAIVLDSLEETFKDLVGGAVCEHQIDISSTAEDYLVKVLCAFLPEEKMIVRGSYLKDLLREALDSDGIIRREYLRVTGDIALFVAGIFPDSFESKKKAFTLGDYIDIGTIAYDNINSDVFDELAFKFPEAVDTLNTVSIAIDLSSKSMLKYLKRRRYIDVRIARR